MSNIDPPEIEADALPPAVAEYLAANCEELVGIAETLVGYDTQNPPSGTTAVVKWLETTIANVGIAVERFTVESENPNLLATLPGETARTLCFNGHLDTGRFDASDWSRDPLGERVDDRLYGRGTTDMKGAVAAMTQVGLAYVATGTEPPVMLQFAFVSDEETGGDAGLTTILEHGGVRPGRLCRRRDDIAQRPLLGVGCGPREHLAHARCLGDSRPRLAADDQRERHRPPVRGDRAVTQ